MFYCKKCGKRFKNKDGIGVSYCKDCWNPLPPDNKTWWRAPHCGPGSINGEELCECERTQIECAKANTKAIKKHKNELDMDCGCSGFWCWKCGRFWAQDSCWERSGADYASADDSEMIEKDGFAFCVCGNKLYKIATD
uniref:Uncharacterized protein n=1 Tax=viral metagenome TaxID=1070528 RepID=A0A6M3LL36_9ZZZZ